MFSEADGRAASFKWTYAHAVGLDDIAANYLTMWEQLLTNKKVGLVFHDDAGGRLWVDESGGLPPMAAALGYECVLPSLVPVGDDDFSGSIAEFIRDGCEICCAVLPAVDFITFWKQAAALDYRPKIMTGGEALMFPQALEAIGPRAHHLTAEKSVAP